MENESELISLDADDIKRRIFTVRGKQVMLDSDLAEYFGTPTGNLNRAMKRNIKRFPENFCFQITAEEVLKCQFGISNQLYGIQGGRRTLPFHGCFVISKICYPVLLSKNFCDIIKKIFSNNVNFAEPVLYI